MSTAIPPSFFQTLGTEMVNIHVGPTKQLYKLHKTLLCQKLHYFAAVFPAEEKTVESIDMPTLDPDAFDLLVQYVYGRSIEIPRPRTQAELRAVTDGAVRSTIKLYGVAEKLADGRLMDEAMSALYPIYRWCGHPSGEEVRLAYEVSGKGSLLRDFMAGSLVWRLVFASRLRGRYERRLAAKRGEGMTVEEKGEEDGTEEENAEEGMPGEEKPEEQKPGQDNPGEDNPGEENPAQDNLPEKIPQDSQTPSAPQSPASTPSSPSLNPQTSPPDPDAEFAQDASAFHDLTLTIPDLSKDMFRWLYNFSENLVAPADWCVCEYHRHDPAEEEECPGSRRFPALQEPALYPRVSVEEW